MNKTRNLFMMGLTVLMAIYLAGCETEDQPKEFPTPTPCPGTEYVNYEGETYPTVLINGQCWMARNLNVGHQLGSKTAYSDNDTIEKYCYNNETANCEKFGGLYPWDEIMQYSAVKPEGAQGICPPGWHIPTREEFVDLIYCTEGYIGYLMKDDPSWGGYADEVKSDCPNCMNSTGYNLYPSGKAFLMSLEDFRDLGEEAYLWSSSEYVMSFYKNGYYFDASIEYNYNCYAVRCIKDE
jgi:uncharacterized protein (TIGR02145 family)